MHFIICKSISLSVEVIFCAIQGGMQSVFRFTFKDLFQHFFLRVHLRYWKKVIGSAMPWRGGVSMHTRGQRQKKIPVFFPDKCFSLYFLILRLIYFLTFFDLRPPSFANLNFCLLMGIRRNFNGKIIRF